MSRLRQICFGALICVGMLGPNSKFAFAADVWKPITLPFISEWTLYVAWCYNPTTQSMFIGQYRKGLYESTDEGTTWTRRDDGNFFIPSANIDPFSLSANTSGYMYTLGLDSQGTAIFVSTTAGSHWQSLWPKDVKDKPVGTMLRLWKDPDSPDRMALINMRGGTDESPDLFFSVRVTEDNWESLHAVILTEPQRQYLASTLNTNVCAMTDGKLKCLWDIPAGYKLFPDWNSRQNYAGVFSAKNRQLAVIAKSGIFYSKDAGGTFQRVANLPGNTRDVAVSPDSIFPIYLTADLQNGPRQLIVISEKGESHSYPGPAPQFRLTAVDYAHNVVFAWTTEQFYRFELP